MGKYPKTLGRIQAVWNKLGGEEGVDRFLRGELVVSEPTSLWRQRVDLVYFPVTSDGTTGQQWITRLERGGSRVDVNALAALSSPDFKPTNGVTTQVAVLRGKIFEDEGRNTSAVLWWADRCKLLRPNPEVACLIREKFSDSQIEEMGFRSGVAVMHEPINSFSVDPLLLSTAPVGQGNRLTAYYDPPRIPSSHYSGFAFVASPHSQS